MVQVTVACNGPGCVERHVRECPHGNPNEVYDVLQNWIVVSDKNADGESALVYHFCSTRCLATWSLERQVRPPDAEAAN